MVGVNWEVSAVWSWGWGAVGGDGALDVFSGARTVVSALLLLCLIYQLMWCLCQMPLEFSGYFT